MPPEPDWPMCQCAMARGPSEISLGGAFGVPCLHMEKKALLEDSYVFVYIFQKFSARFARNCMRSTHKHAQANDFC